MFASRHPTAKWCRTPCIRPNAYTPKPPRTVTCLICMQPFPSRQGRARYCSKPCLNQSPASKTARAEAKRRRRARKKGALIEPVSLAYLLKRDHWTCGICKRPIPKHAKYPDPMYRSLDHIVPLAKGGAHSKANCQPAHLLCNSLKSDSGESQLLLFG